MEIHPPSRSVTLQPRWLSLTEAAGFLSAHGVKTARTFLEESLRVGTIAAYGEFEHSARDWAEPDTWSAEGKLISPTFWRKCHEVSCRLILGREVEGDEWEGNWHGGFFWYRTGSEDEWHSEKVSNARVWMPDLAGLLPIEQHTEIETQGISGPIEPTVTAKLENIGGRPAAKHGDVIASATLRLADLPIEELARYTVASLAAELASDYQKLGNAPPSERNRELYSAGILRVIRTRRA